MGPRNRQSKRSSEARFCWRAASVTASEKTRRRRLRPLGKQEKRMGANFEAMYGGGRSRFRANEHKPLKREG